MALAKCNYHYQTLSMVINTVDTENKKLKEEK